MIQAISTTNKISTNWNNSMDQNSLSTSQAMTQITAINRASIMWGGLSGEDQGYDETFYSADSDYEKHSKHTSIYRQ